MAVSLLPLAASATRSSTGAAALEQLTLVDSLNWSRPLGVVWREPLGVVWREPLGVVWLLAVDKWLLGVFRELLGVCRELLGVSCSNQRSAPLASITAPEPQ